MSLKRPKRKYQMPTTARFGYKGKKYASYTPTDKSNIEWGWIDAGRENIYGTGKGGLTKEKAITNREGVYELEKTNKRGTKTKTVSQKRGKRLMKRVAKKATKYDETFGHMVTPTAKGEKITGRIKKRHSEKAGRKAKRYSRRKNK